MPRFCSYCYSRTEKLLLCGKCRKRSYCSSECQKNDWASREKGGSHKLYCGIGGEIGYDYEVTACENSEKGIGMFALREFSRDELIIAERSVYTHLPSSKKMSENSVPETCRTSISELLPIDGSYQEKLDRNSISCGEDASVDGSGLFLTISRINHHCVGNSEHHFLKNRGARILVASKNIAKGEEITFPYDEGGSFEYRQRKLQSYPYFFSCTCCACTGDSSFEINRKLSLIKELDEGIFSSAGIGNIDQAIRKGKELLELFNELEISSWRYHRTFYDLFQVCITKTKHSKVAMEYLQKAVDAVLRFTKDPEFPELIRLKGLLSNPQSHRNYRILG